MSWTLEESLLVHPWAQLAYPGSFSLRKAQLTAPSIHGKGSKIPIWYLGRKSSAESPSLPQGGVPREPGKGEAERFILVLPPN